MKQPNNLLLKTIFLLTVFSISMGFFESAVVVYLRKIYYPGGFDFPLVSFKEGTIAVTEILREFFSLVMIISISYLAGNNFNKRLAYFLFCFAIWDIFYYIFLKILLGWPASFFTLDILFLIPLIWVGPVLAPILNSLTMIALSFAIISISEKKLYFKINITKWILLISGSIITIAAYCEDHLNYMLNKFSFFELFSSTKKDEVILWSDNYIPGDFNWLIFVFGELLFLSVIFMILKRHSK